jgi:UDP-N-acetylglucosamine--N-acetylmuramyl-(pentapeptide) pyrophosphoryl-undecaprenol N-acetylglucosamine transferase
VATSTRDSRLRAPSRKLIRASSHFLSERGGGSNATCCPRSDGRSSFSTCTRSIERVRGRTGRRSGARWERGSGSPVRCAARGPHALSQREATTHKIPIVLQEQNTFPGITTRFFSRFAAQVHLGFPEARQHISPAKTTEVFDSGNPIEPPPADAFEKTPARVKWGFAPTGGSVLLVYGGSQGSKAINDAVAGWIDRGLPPDLFVIWATGKTNYDELARYDSARVKVRAYIAPISEAYRAADFALSRAGAMATAELCAWGIPVIVVPLPTAAADHQTANAKALAAAGAAEMILQSNLNTDSLSSAVESMLSNPAKLATMRAKALERSRPTAAADIAQHILRLVESGQGRR